MTVASVVHEVARAWQRRPSSSGSNQSAGVGSRMARCLRRAPLSARAAGRCRITKPSSSSIRAARCGASLR